MYTYIILGINTGLSESTLCSQVWLKTQGLTFIVPYKNTCLNSNLGRFMYIVGFVVTNSIFWQHISRAVKRYLPL